MAQGKDRNERDTDGRMVSIAWHDIGHVFPPFLHDGKRWQRVHGVVFVVVHDGEEGRCLRVKKYAVVVDPSLAQCVYKIVPDIVVSTTIGVVLVWVEVHLERTCLHRVSISFFIYMSRRRARAIKLPQAYADGVINGDPEGCVHLGGSIFVDTTECNHFEPNAPITKSAKAIPSGYRSPPPIDNYRASHATNL